MMESVARGGKFSSNWICVCPLCFMFCLAQNGARDSVIGLYYFYSNSGSYRLPECDDNK